MSDPFEWNCNECGEKQYEEVDTVVNSEGRLVSVKMRCLNCSTIEESGVTPPINVENIQVGVEK